MKYNFKLTKKNWKSFVHRFNHMMDRTGMIISKGVYTGRQNQYGMLKKKLGKNAMMVRFFVPKPMDFIWADVHTTHFLIAPNLQGITMSQNGGSYLYIAFGTKMFISSERIYWKEGDKFLGGSTNNLYPFKGNRYRALSNIAHEIQYEKDYWEDQEREFFKDRDFLKEFNS